MLNKWGFCGSYLEEDQKANEDQEIAQLQDLIKPRTAILGTEHKLIIRLQSDLEERSKAQQDPAPPPRSFSLLHGTCVFLMPGRAHRTTFSQEKARRKEKLLSR
jgi:hypothetical protein